MHKTVVIIFIMLNICSSSFTMFRASSKRFITTVKSISTEQKLASLATKQDLLSNLSASMVFRHRNTIEQMEKITKQLQKVQSRYNVETTTAQEAVHAIISNETQKFDIKQREYRRMHDKLEQCENELLCKEND